MIRKLLITLSVLLLLAALYLLYLIWDAGEFRKVSNLHPGTCRQITGLPGSEDITLHPDGSHAWISSDDRRSVQAGEPEPGAIYRYDLLDPDAVPVNMTPDAGVDFRPHGLSLYVGPDGQETLFVVSHPGQSLFSVDADHEGPAHTVEIFDIVDGVLVHRRSLSNPMLISPNDIVAVDHQRFYVSNDHGAAPGFMRQIEGYLRMAWANVVYFDGEQFEEAAAGLTFANGINLSPDGSRLYVAEVTRSRVQEYLREPQTGAIYWQRTIKVGFGVDNIEVDRDSGELFIAGHVKLLSFVRHAANAAKKAPSQAVRVKLGNDDYALETVFMDDGELISGASVAAVNSRVMLIGSVFEPHVVECRF